MDAHRGQDKRAGIGSVALLGAEPRHGLDERLDRERLVQHRLRAEPIDLVPCLFVRRAHDDWCRGEALLDPSHQRAGEPAVVSMKTSEIGDDKTRSRAGSHVLETVDERQLITLIAQHVAKEVPDGAVVFDDQNVSHVRQAGGYPPSAQFRCRWN